MNLNDKVRWGTDNGIVISSDLRTYDVRFDSGTEVTFLKSTNRFDDGKSGIGEAVVLLSKATNKKQVKLFRWEKIGTTSTGQPFVKQTEGLYDETHAAKVLTGFVKVIGSERIVEV